MEDGTKEILPAVVLETLRQLDMITSEELNALKKYHILEIKNHKGDKIGETKIEFT